MNQIVAFSLLTLFSTSAFAFIPMKRTPKLIYGVDDRKDYTDASSQHQVLADATAIMIPRNSLIQKENGNFTLNRIQDLNTRIHRNIELCSGEQFSEQPAIGSCSAFLVAEDTLVTAGHCVALTDPHNFCRSFVWLHDFAKSDENDNFNLADIDPSRVLECNEVHFSFDEKDDFAVIKLTKPSDRTPLNFRQEGQVADDAELMVIGYPSGLPVKIAPAGTIIDNTQPNAIVASLDTYQGNSGSAVFNAETLEVEGILSAGKSDFLLDSSGETPCLRSNTCNQDGSNCAFEKQNPEDAGNEPPGEIVYRITEVVPLFHSMEEEVAAPRFGPFAIFDALETLRELNN